jgi:GNAT superfamily N-acetyltransferase
MDPDNIYFAHIVNNEDLSEHPLEKDIVKWGLQEPYMIEEECYRIKYRNRKGKLYNDLFIEKGLSEMLVDKRYIIEEVTKDIRKIPRFLTGMITDWTSEEEEIAKLYFMYTKGDFGDNILIGLSTFEPSSFELEHMEIHPEYRGRGLFKYFLDYIFNEIKESGIRTFYLNNGAGEMGERSYTNAGIRNGFKVTSMKYKMIFYNDITEVANFLLENGSYLYDKIDRYEHCYIRFEKFNEEYRDDYEHLIPELTIYLEYIKRKENLVMRIDETEKTPRNIPCCGSLLLE